MSPQAPLLSHDAIQFSERPATAPTNEVPHGITEAAIWTNHMNALVSAMTGGKLNGIKEGQETEADTLKHIAFGKADDIYASVFNQTHDQTANADGNALPSAKPSDSPTVSMNSDVQSKATIDDKQTKLPHDSASTPQDNRQSSLPSTNDSQTAQLQTNDIPSIPMWKILDLSDSAVQKEVASLQNQFAQNQSDQGQSDGDQQNDKNQQPQSQEIASMEQLDDTAGSQDYESTGSSSPQSAKIRKALQNLVLSQVVSDRAWLENPQAFEA